MKSKIIIFDFDGVLVNTLPRWFDLASIHNPDITYKYFQDLSNGNFHEVTARMSDQKVYVIPPKNEEHHSMWLKETELVPQMYELVQELSKEYTLFVVSSALTSNIVEYFERVGLREYFQSIRGFDVHFSKIIKINNILEQEKVDPKDVVFITDTLGDIREGNVCKVYSIGVTWGLHDRETLEKGEPVAIVDTVSELKQSIESILNVDK